MGETTMWPSSEEKRFFPPSIKPLRVASLRRDWISSRRRAERKSDSLSSRVAFALPRIPPRILKLKLFVQLADSSKSFSVRMLWRWFSSWLGSPVTWTISGFFCGQFMYETVKTTTGKRKKQQFAIQFSVFVFIFLLFRKKFLFVLQNIHFTTSSV